MMVVKEIENGLLEEVEVSLFGKKVMILEWMSCVSILVLTKTSRGFLEKFGWWFEQDIDDEREEVEEDEEDEDEEDAKDGLAKHGSASLRL
ncbi:hypothetical protein Tco_0014366 [Tanacetum coccineum]